MIKMYPTASSGTSWNEEAILEFQTSLQSWHDETPSFFHPSSDGAISATDEPSLFEVPWTFKRSVCHRPPDLITKPNLLPQLPGSTFAAR
jgi:hypothetical protein